MIYMESALCRFLIVVTFEEVDFLWNRTVDSLKTSAVIPYCFILPCALLIFYYFHDM